MYIGASLIQEERTRQVTEEGWSSAHDRNHEIGELTKAALCYLEAGCYAAATHKILADPPDCWPWKQSDWKPTENPVRNLVKAGALVAAEIDKLSSEEECP